MRHLRPRARVPAVFLPAFDMVVAEALAKGADLRYRTARDMSAALRIAANPEGVVPLAVVCSGVRILVPAFVLPLCRPLRIDSGDCIGRTQLAAIARLAIRSSVDATSGRTS